MLKALRFALAHRYALVGVVSMLICLWFLLSGCAGAKITPAVNQVNATQTSSGPTKRTTITVGKPAVSVQREKPK